MTTINRSIDGTGFSTLRIDTDEKTGKTSITVYNCAAENINKLIGMLEAVKEDMRKTLKPEVPPMMIVAVNTTPSVRYENKPLMPAASKRRTRTCTITNVQQRNMMAQGLSVMELLPDDWAADIMESKATQTRSIRIYGITPEKSRISPDNGGVIKFHRAFDRTFQEGVQAVYQITTAGNSHKANILSITKTHIAFDCGKIVRRVNLRQFIALNME